MKIKELREEHRLTQRELAEKIGNSQRNVSNWENGTSEPDIETLVRLCRVFGVTLEELVGLETIGKNITADEWRMICNLRTFDARRQRAFYEIVRAFSTD